MNFSISKRFLILAAAAAVLCMAPATQAERGKLSIAADGIYSKDITSNNIEELGTWGVHEEVSSGMGGYLLIDYRFLKFMTAGIGFGALEYTGDAGGRYNSMLDLAGRIILAPDKKLEPYLLGGIGKNILKDTLEVSWWGNYHAQAGIGLRYALGSKLDLDTAVVADVWSPKDEPMKAVGGRLGLAFNPGGSKGDRVEKEWTEKKREVKEEPKAKAPVTEEAIPPAPEVAAAQAEVAPPPPVEEESIYAELEPLEQAPKPVEAAKPAEEIPPPEEPVEVAKPVEKPKPAVKPAAPAEGKPAITYHEVERGDTLWGIAKSPENYNDGFQWPLIFKANRDQIQDPDLIYPEQVLKVRHDISDTERAKARKAASDTPSYVPHTKPRETLPVDYFDW